MLLQDFPGSVGCRQESSKSKCPWENLW